MSGTTGAGETSKEQGAGANEAVHDQALENYVSDRDFDHLRPNGKAKKHSRPNSLARLSSPINRTPSSKSTKKSTQHQQNIIAARFSKRRIGGDYALPIAPIPHGQAHAQMGRNSSLSRDRKNKNNSTYSSSVSNLDEGVSSTSPPSPSMSMPTPTPMAMPMALGLGRGGSTGKVPMPVDLGFGRRNSKNDITRERSKSSLSSGFSENVVVKGGSEIIIRYGELLKKGVVDMSWKRRFFVLTDKHIYYYTQVFEVPMEFQQIDIAPKAQIPLNVIEDCRKDKEDPSGTKFNIYTPARTYRLKMETDRGADAWVGAIAGACENAKQQLHPLFNGRRESFNSIKADELDVALSSSGFKNPMKQLRSEEKLLVNKARKKGSQPHQPAAIEEFGKWSKFDVAAWLHTINMSKYSEVFYQNGVDGTKLRELTKVQDVMNLGVEDADVMALLNAVENLKINSFEEIDE